MADLLDKSVPAEYFADRIVLIGPYAAGLQDQYITSANHAQPMYGVEIQANAVQALLEGNYKQEAPGLAQAAVLFAAMLLPPTCSGPEACAPVSRFGRFCAAVVCGRQRRPMMEGWCFTRCGRLWG